LGNTFIINYCTSFPPTPYLVIVMVKFRYEVELRDVEYGHPE